MKALFFFFAFLFFGSQSFGQSRSLGLQLGSGNSQNDISTTNNPASLIQEIRPQIGIFTRKYLNPSFSWKTGLNYAQLAGADTLHTNESRGLSYRTNLFEITNQLEYNLVKNEQVKVFSLIGLNAFYLFEPVSIRAGEETRQTQQAALNAAAMLGFGWRIPLDRSWSLGGEFTYHITTTDYLDAMEVPSNGYNFNDFYYHFTLEISKTLRNKRGKSGSNECPSF